MARWQAPHLQQSRALSVPHRGPGFRILLKCVKMFPLRTFMHSKRTSVWPTAPVNITTNTETATNKLDFLMPHFRPHRMHSTDAVYCDRCRDRPHACYAWSVCVRHRSEPAKTAEPIEMPLGGLTRVGPRNHVLDRGLDPQRAMSNFGGCLPH